MKRYIGWGNMKNGEVKQAPAGKPMNTVEGTRMRERCFACDRPLGRFAARVDTRDDQIVRVGSECFKLIEEAGEAGYQPPKGGPRLFLIPRCESCGGTDDDPTECTQDCDEPRRWPLPQQGTPK